MLNVGDQAPDFRLQTEEGKEVSLAVFRGKRVLVYFYPKANTPGCTVEACEFRDLRPKFDKQDTVILGVSADSVKGQAGFKAKQKLNFSLLSDPDFQAIEGFGARRMKRFLGKTALGIVRSSYLVGPDGRIEYIWDNVKAKGHAGDVLEVISGLAKK
ncbi:MAG: thioredoxin-dependent thiol peroxidase [Candidatus Acidiferrales bacterium]|jgi:peroxiredoxin Q/BCP